MKALLLMALALVVPSVEAVEASQSHKLSWTMATTREDKSPLRTVAGPLKSAWSAEKCAEVLALPNPPQITIELVLQVTQ